MTCILATTDCIGVKFVTNYKVRLQQLCVLEKGKLFNVCEVICLLSFVMVN